MKQKLYYNHPPKESGINDTDEEIAKTNAMLNELIEQHKELARKYPNIFYYRGINETLPNFTRARRD